MTYNNSERQKNQSPIFRRADLMLILILFLCGLLAFAFLKLNEKPGASVQVSLDGRLFGVYPLDEDQEILISDETSLQISSPDSLPDPSTETDTDGRSWRNLLVIKDGQAFISEADCPDKICVAHKPVRKKGETIICLPHKLVVEVQGAAAEDFDIIAK